MTTTSIRGPISVCMVFLLAVGTSNAAPFNLYVATNGNDGWSGRRAAPNALRTDGPFASLERARDAVRSLRRAGKAPAGGATVWIRGGEYPRAQTFRLTAEDSGTARSPVVYRTYRDETVRLIGGRAIAGWKAVSDASILARLDPAARGHVLQADLRAQGITDFGRFSRRGFGQPDNPAALELFFQDRPMTLARWPNEGWAKIAGTPGGPEGGRFTYEGDRPARWKNADDVWLHGYWTFDWADSYEKVAYIDTEKREIVTAPPHGVYGYAAGKRYYALNALEELDSPGEWYVDRQTGILYFWPPALIQTSRAVVSLLEGPLVEMSGVSYVTLRGLTLEDSRGAGVVIRAGEHDLVAGCTLRNLGTNAVQIEGGAQDGVVACDIFDVGDAGIQLQGGDRKTLTPAGHFAINNHIHHYSRWDRTYRPAVKIDGVGNRVAHNLIHDAPHNAILLGGNDHLIEYNDISRVCLETGDAGAFYMGRDFTMRGNVVRYNHFHDMARTLSDGGGFVDVMSVYLDDCASGTTVYGNLFTRAGRAVMIGGGRDNAVENNIFVDCSPSIHVDARGKSWAAKYFVPNGEWRIFETVAAMRVDQPPYSRYPHLSNILQDDPAFPKYDRIVRNICRGGKWIEWLDGLSDKVVEVKDNLVEPDPGFPDAARGDWRLRPDSPALKLGFKPLPRDQIGLVRDEFRRVLNPSHSARP